MRTTRNTGASVSAYKGGKLLECEVGKGRWHLTHARHFPIALSYPLILALGSGLLTSCGSADATTETTDSTATPVTV
ncbi:MAG TPA: hypothetical protein VGE21_15095, partial [Flavobacteriales bacterium]